MRLIFLSTRVLNPSAPWPTYIVGTELTDLAGPPASRIKLCADWLPVPTALTDWCLTAIGRSPDVLRQQVIEAGTGVTRQDFFHWVAGKEQPLVVFYNAAMMAPAFCRWMGQEAWIGAVGPECIDLHTIIRSAKLAYEVAGGKFPGWPDHIAKLMVSAGPTAGSIIDAIEEENVAAVNFYTEFVGRNLVPRLMLDRR